MKTNEQSILKLLKDDFFIKWVVNSDPVTDDFWRRWLLNHPEELKNVNRAKEILHALKLKEVHKIDQKQYETILDNILLHQRKQHLQLHNQGFKFWYVAASVVLLLSIGFIFYQINPPAETTAIVEQTFKSKEVPTGIKYTLKLPDGSIVKLNSGSKIIYPQAFNDTIRKVVLEGEAFFDVVKNPDQPFIIETGYASTQVLGTSFNVKQEKEKVEVAVVSGSVKVINSFGHEQLLNPHERGVITKSDQEITKEEFDFKEVVGWKDGILLFNKADFDEILTRLSNWYGVEFILSPGIDVSGVYSGEYHNEALEDVLSGIAYSSGFKYKIEDNKVYINQ